MLAMVAGTASAGLDGGQLNISGLVVDNTCETRVDGGNKDGTVLLQTATVAEISAGVLNDTVGAKAKPFSITVDCSNANPNLVAPQNDLRFRVLWQQQRDSEQRYVY